MQFRPGLLALSLLVGAAAASAAPLTVYDDQLRNGFADWSWAAHNLAQTSTVHAGSAAISFEPDGWAGFFLHRDLGIRTEDWEAVEFWIHGGPGGGQNLTVALVSGGTPVGEGALAPFIAGGAVPAGQWAKASIPFASLGVTAGTFDGFWLQDGTGGNQAATYIDDIVLVPRPPSPPTPVTVAVDPDAGRRRIDPRIYGVNFGSAAQMSDLHWPVRRWGGNATTRYSWQHDIANRASDWFFYNIEEDNPNPGNLPNGSAADRFIDETRTGGGEPLITVPLIGWTPIDRQRRWGFSVAKYGVQQQTECTLTGTPWCQPDAGNGLRPNGAPVTGNDPHDTSREIGPDFVTGWMAHTAGKVKYFALDNEPMLWSSSHRDVHPARVHDTELWQRTLQYAAAMKAADPEVRIFGPDTWGWCDLFYSEADNCAPGSDYNAHGAFLPWYLDQVRQVQQAQGVRLIDFVDLHYYPQGTNVALSNDESEATAARRLRSLKGLYDPAYVDESWIGQPVRLLPRVREWIAGHLPGVGLAVTEYNWGDGGVSSALAQAEALAIFGREGVDVAARWVSPAANSLIEDAFRMYLDYDGAGARVDGDSVQAVSSDVDAVGAYAVRGTGARLWLLLFNKDTQARDTAVGLPAGVQLVSSATLYRFDGAHRLGPAGTVAATGGQLALTLPGRSATLAQLELAPAQPADFYTLPAPCRLIDTRTSDPTNGGPKLTAGVERLFAATGRCGLPAAARALAVNVTVVGPTAGGYLTGYPGGSAPPITSLVNFRAGQARSNNAVLSLARNGAGTLALRASFADLDVVVDVTGWFQ
ncbi:MAG TPA: glycoside hydrolase family 44 protein [Thermoanaerobaculia bacterium]|nr:glycoside hydrolase family 44 protein [Thermoanaerobaculia bacterium]